MPFEGPIHLDQEAAAHARAREVRCACDRSPFCRGQLSADWLSCNPRCKACQPPPWQPPVTASVQAGTGGLDAE
jgi:hypothetical protein